MENQEKAQEQRAETRVHPETTIPEENRKRNPRWRSEEAREVLDRWRKSGVSLLSFSRESGIGYQGLLAWRKKLNKSESSDFVRINVAGTVGSDIEIALTNGRIVRCGVGLDPRYLKTVVEVNEPDRHCADCGRDLFPHGILQPGRCQSRTPFQRYSAKTVRRLAQLPYR